MEEQQIFKTAGCLIHGELPPLPSFRIAMHHGFVVLLLFFSFLKCPVEDGVQRNSAALENGGKSAPRPILMFIRVSCVFGPDHKQNSKTGADLSICPGSLLGLLAMTEGGLKPQRNHRFRRAQNPTHRILRVSITETSWAPLCSYQKHPCLTPTPGAPRPARIVFSFCWGMSSAASASASRGGPVMGLWYCSVCPVVSGVEGVRGFSVVCRVSHSGWRQRPLACLQV